MEIIDVNIDDPRYSPDQCPTCGPTGGSFSCHDETYSDREYMVTMYCPTCQTRWQETYVLRSVVVVID